MKFHRLYKESSGGLTKDEFYKLFYDYVDVADEYYCQEGYKSKNANMLKSKMEEFIDTVKSNVSRDYKRAEPDWEKYVNMVINGLDDNICDGDDDWIESKKRQLWYDFISYKPLVGTNTNESSDAPVDIKKLLKMNGVTRFPPSTDFWKDSVSWFREETGFTGDKHLRRMAKQLEEAGWKKMTSNNVRVDKFVSPDGKVVATLDITIVRTKKWYSITFKCANTINESVDDEKSFKNLLKQNGVTKLPSGSQIKSDRISWSKRGGYAGRKTLDQIRDVLEDAGWKRGEWKPNGSPDGSWMSNSDSYTSPDGKIVMSYYSYYGATSRDNSYGFTFKLAEIPMNESTIKGTGRVDFDDDLVAVYDPSGKLEYKGLFDDCPYKDDDMRYDRTTMTYRIEGPDGDYRTMAKLSESSMNESSRFGFKVGDRVVLTKDKSNRFSGDFIPAGTEGEVVAIDKPMPGIMKVKIEDWKVISVPERQLRNADKEI